MNHRPGQDLTTDRRERAPAARDGEGSHAPPVLVVDDVPEHGAATVAALAAEGYPTVTEQHGDAVLRQVRAQVVRLVVSELYVPCSEGRCVVMCFKQDRQRLPQLRVLVHTRHVADADRAWALDAGCDGLVPKTAPPAVLLREVRRLDALEIPGGLQRGALGIVHGDAAEPALADDRADAEGTSSA